LLCFIIKKLWIVPVKAFVGVMDTANALTTYVTAKKVGEVLLISQLLKLLIVHSELVRLLFLGEPFLKFRILHLKRQSRYTLLLNVQTKVSVIALLEYVYVMLDLRGKLVSGRYARINVLDTEGIAS
jgi:hypothetical protein